MGKATLQAFDVGEGDCVFLKLENNAITFSIMVDCGKFSEAVKRFVSEELGNHINLLIITHIDNDHIDGVKEMLKQIPDLFVDRIIFNCVQECNYSAGPHFPKERLASIKTRKDIHFPQPVNTNISAPSALSLTELFLSNENLKRAWATQQHYLTSDCMAISLPEGFGTLSFLSPEKSAITKLDKNFRKSFNKEFYTKYNGPYDKEPTLYELLLLAHEDKATTQARKTIHYTTESELMTKLDQTELRHKFKFGLSKVCIHEFDY